MPPNVLAQAQILEKAVVGEIKKGYMVPPPLTAKGIRERVWGWAWYNSWPVTGWYFVFNPYLYAWNDNTMVLPWSRRIREIHHCHGGDPLLAEAAISDVLPCCANHPGVGDFCTPRSGFMILKQWASQNPTWLRLSYTATATGSSPWW